jgi:hypothetical protein
MNTMRAIGRRAMLVTAVLGLGVVTTGCFRPSGDLKALRDGVIAASGGEWDAEVQVGVGALTFGLVRGGAAFFDLPPEVGVVLRSVRGAEVAVYRHQAQGGRKGDPAGVELLQAADGAMDKRGFERLVGVLDRGRVVAIYLPHEAGSRGQVRACVLVVDGPQMVIAGVRGYPEPLLELAFQEIQKETEGGWALSRGP